jgi:diguanylate cyclase (GGDEF)-like protein/putative nucleotidyltransferase with HDIG domain
MLFLIIVFSLTFAFLWYSKNFYSAKVLILIPVIIASTAFGKYIGIVTAILSSALLFVFDYEFTKGLTDTVFQANLIIGSVAVLSAWLVGGLIEVEKKTQQELVKLADYDQLTGLYNHRYLQEKLAATLENAFQKNTTVSVVLLDIEQFRYYNAVCGYQQGDALLTAIGALLQQELREPYYAARYGSDEFMLVFPGLNKSMASEIAAGIEKMIQSLVIPRSVGPKSCLQPFMMSAGAAGFPEDGIAALPLIRAAENDLFRNKYSRGKPYLYQSVLSEISSLKIKDAFPTLQSLVTLINTKDKYTFGHSERVMSYALALAEKLGLTEDEKDTLRYGAYLHDIGKIEIETAVLRKETSLDEDEWKMMKSHTVRGSEMILPLAAFKEIVPIIRSHHENYDGSGYPDGLKGRDIPLVARILRIADSFDAMTSDRPYREALSFARACEELKKYGGSYYDPELVAVFLGTVEEVYRKEHLLEE